MRVKVLIILLFLGVALFSGCVESQENEKEDLTETVSDYNFSTVKDTNSSRTLSNNIEYKEDQEVYKVVLGVRVPSSNYDLEIESITIEDKTLVVKGKTVEKGDFGLAVLTNIVGTIVIDGSDVEGEIENLKVEISGNKIEG